MATVVERRHHHDFRADQALFAFEGLSVLVVGAHLSMYFPDFGASFVERIAAEEALGSPGFVQQGAI